MGQTLFILLSNHPNLLLTTVLSRCLTFQFHVLSSGEVTHILANSFAVEPDKAAEFAPWQGAV
ncbi:hypothetical protein N752_15490 [Desulforamulus aquiferis]|nr:hypothetical protein N752_15490 [Desulforamulus aquiferis]